jgi:prephenate dehydrogenase
VSAVAVVGLGLMGGSLLRTLSAEGRPARGWSPDPEERAAAARLPGVEVPGELDATLEGARGVVLATPLSAFEVILGGIAAGPRPSWITDVGSLQGPPLGDAAALGLGEVYVSSHPMVGGHRSGFGAGRAGLYAGATVWVSARDEARAGAAVCDFWRDLGADPSWVDADEHDRRMARVSHLPQVVSTHLAALLAEAGLGRGELGPGGRDMTRLAGSDPRMWRDILSAPPTLLPAARRALAARLAEEADRLEGGDAGGFASLLEATRAWSDS